MKPIVKPLIITVPVVVAGALGLGNIVATKAPPARVELTERATAVRVIEAREMAGRPLVQGDIALVKTGLAAGSQVVDSTPRPVIAGMLLTLMTDDALMQSVLAAAQ